MCCVCGVDLGVLPAASDPYNGTPWEALQFGALLSATDPVASLSVLSSMAQLKVRGTAARHCSGTC
eukprot:COSAG05_NODE_14394_length_398_cov_0.682274_2_plen_65_part_01